MHYAQLISFYYPLDISPNSDYNISSTISDLLSSDFEIYIINYLNEVNHEHGFYCTYQQIFKRIQSHI